MVWLPGIYCPEVADTTVTWPQTEAGTAADGVCVPGFMGTAIRQCTLNGNWLRPDSTCVRTSDRTYLKLKCFCACSLSCTELRALFFGRPLLHAEGLCQPENTVSESWTTAPANTNNVEGTCNDGYYVPEGSLPPTRSCLLNSTWSNVVNPCQRMSLALPTEAGFIPGGSRPHHAVHATRCTAAERFCKEDQNSNAQFEAAPAGSVRTGTCLPGFEATNGPPQRQCLLSGTWSPDLVGGAACTGTPAVPRCR